MDYLQSGYGFDIYSSVTKWQTGVDMINNQNCLAINIGSNGEIPLPTINLPVQDNRNVTQFGFGTSYNCYFVFIGKLKYISYLYFLCESIFISTQKIILGIKDMSTIDTIAYLVEEIVAQFEGKRPISVYLLGKHTTSDIKIVSKMISSPIVSKKILLLICNLILFLWQLHLIFYHATLLFIHT